MRPASSGADAPLVQREHRALRDDEQAAQLGEPRDDVVGERVGRPAARAVRRGALDERHHRDGGAAAAGARSAGRTGSAARRRRHRRRGGLRARRAPGVAQRRGVEAFGLEQPRRGRARCSSPSRMRPRRASAPSSSSCTCRSNGASCSHFSRYASASSSGTLLDEMLEQRGVAAAEAPPLRGEPAVEEPGCGRSRGPRGSRRRTARRARAAAPAPACSMPSSAARGDLERVDEAIGEVEPRLRRSRVDDARAPGSSTMRADLAQAPAQFAARIVRDVPQQLAELAPRRRLRA